MKPIVKLARGIIGLLPVAMPAMAPGFSAQGIAAAEDHQNNHSIRKPTSPADLEFWLKNMVVFHRFTPDEVQRATGLSVPEIQNTIRQLGLNGQTPPPRLAGEPLRVLPYPGGRHPRIGFQDGAIAPQRETKVSIFTPWDESSYVVADIPEAIFSNLGLTYLAHTHVPTLWTEQNLQLPTQEWERRPDGSLRSERNLPNGITFGAEVMPEAHAVRMRLWLRNGTSKPLTELRVQNCVMLAGTRGFTAQSNDGKVFQPPYTAAKSAEADRWIITGWVPNQRCWGNAPCPCLHSDPQFPNCQPGETVQLQGWLSFYEGKDLAGELKRIDALGWTK